MKQSRNQPAVRSAWFSESIYCPYFPAHFRYRLIRAMVSGRPQNLQNAFWYLFLFGHPALVSRFGLDADEPGTVDRNAAVFVRV